MKPLKHAELIKAWADGAEIEFFSPTDHKWLFVPFPNWDATLEYRIKLKKELKLSESKVFDLHFRCYTDIQGVITKVEVING